MLGRVSSLVQTHSVHVRREIERDSVSYCYGTVRSCMDRIPEHGPASTVQQLREAYVYVRYVTARVQYLWV